MRKTLVSLLFLCGVAMAAPETYTIDLSHSQVGFKVQHFFSKVPGRFSKFSGTIVYDAQKPEQSRVSVEIDASSINTDNEKRDDHLRNADFFDVKKYPTIKFESRSVSPKGKDRLIVKGDFTMKGVTKPVELDVAVLGAGPDGWGGYRSGFEATTSVHRPDFNIVWNTAIETGGFVLGNDVAIQLNIEAIREAPKTKEVPKKN